MDQLQWPLKYFSIVFNSDLYADEVLRHFSIFYRRDYFLNINGWNVFDISVDASITAMFVVLPLIFFEFTRTLINFRIAIL